VAEAPIAGAVTAAALMSSPVVAVTMEHSLAAAWEAMRQRDVHHLAVLDSDGLVAVLDDRTVATEWPVGGPEAPHRRRVGEIVRRRPRCVLPETSAAEVARAMVESGCDAVPVVTSTGGVVGLVTSTDLVMALARGVAIDPPWAQTWEGGRHG